MNSATTLLASVGRIPLLLRVSLLITLAAAAAAAGGCAEVTPSGSADAGGDAGAVLDATSTSDSTASDAAPDAVDVDAPVWDGEVMPSGWCGNTECTVPPSVCADDNTLRFYVSECDAGACAAEAREEVCIDSPVKPNCFDGACRAVVLR